MMTSTSLDLIYKAARLVSDAQDDLEGAAALMPEGDDQDRIYYLAHMLHNIYSNLIEY